MKKIMFMLIVICTWCDLCAQVDFKVEILKIFNYNVDYSGEEIDEDWGDGPYLNFNCVLKNIGVDSIILKRSKCKFYINYAYRGILYKDELDILEWNNKTELLSLAGGKKFNFTVGLNIFLGTNILQDKKGNYLSELLQVVPTVSIICKGKDILFESNIIEHVSLME